MLTMAWKAGNSMMQASKKVAEDHKVEQGFEDQDSSGHPMVVALLEQQDTMHGARDFQDATHQPRD